VKQISPSNAPSGHNGFIFVILVSNGDKFIFQAPTAPSRKQWIEGLNKLSKIAAKRS